MPRTGESHPDTRREAAAGPIGESNTALLLVDDDPDDHVLVRSALRQIGYAGGFEAVETVDEAMTLLLRGGGPRLVLLDVNLPGQSGFELLRELRKRPEFLPTRVVMLTTSRAPSDIHAAWQAGADGYLVKPSGFDDWVRVFRAIVDYWFGAIQFP